MPAPATCNSSSAVPRPFLGHVNLMVDTFIANASPDDLRAVVRGLLASGTPGFAATFTSAARHCLRHTTTKPLPAPYHYFAVCQTTPDSSPIVTHTPYLDQALTRARSYYGVGMGFASLSIFTDIIRSTYGLQWDDSSSLPDVLSIIDSDITQAIQSSKEEIEAGRVQDWASARAAVDELRFAIRECHREVKSWGGDLPFERASSSIQYWKL